MSRKIVVKFWNGDKKELDIGSNESYDHFVEKLNKELALESNKCYKFLSKGKMVTRDNFDTIPCGTILLALSCNKSPIIDESSNKDKCSCTCHQQNQTQSQTNAINVSDPVADELSNDTIYTYDQVKSSMIVFLDFIRSNPQVRYMYENDFPQLVNEMIHNPIIANVLKNILGQSKHIMHAIKTGGNISINVGENGSVDEIHMTPEDSIIIEEIINMGFDSNEVVVTYLKYNKNKEKTIETLLERKY